MTDTSDTYNYRRYCALRRETTLMNERNDCSVKAIAMIYDYDYIDAHMLLTNLGRKYRHGFDVDLAIKYLGRASKKQYVRQPNKSKYTVKTIANTIPVGKYLVFTSGHVLACINGKIYDWTEDRKHRVTYIIEIDSMMDFL